MRKNVKVLAVMLVLAISSIQLSKTNACTRVIYKSADGTVMLTARSMDWNMDLQTKLWYFPAHMERTGIVDETNFKWKSNYSSIVASALNMCSADGINDQGLVANALWLKESEFPEINRSAGDMPGMPVSVLVQYILDTYANVDELVKDGLGKHKFKVFTVPLPYELKKMVTLHLSVSDKSGNSAIIEFIKGEMKIYHNPDYLVMTNSPTFDIQIRRYEIWSQVDGSICLPGTNSSEDRFCRAAYYTNNVTLDQSNALAGIISIIRDCSVPVGIPSYDPEKPNISTTLWRTVADSKKGTYYFESSLQANRLRMDFINMPNISKDSCGVYDPYLTEFVKNDISELFIETEPFKFAGY
jgi:penicillin V acylase-like amidase (Ntn superfamily)